MNKIVITLLIVSCCFWVHRADAQLISVGPDASLNIEAGTSFNIGGLTLIPSSKFTLGGTSLTQNSAVTNSTSKSIITDEYKFSNTTNSYIGEIKYKYDVTNLNSIAEADLNLFIHNGSAWQYFSGGSLDVLNKIVSYTPLSSLTLKELTLGQGCPSIPATPTASVTVQPTCVVQTGTIVISDPVGPTYEYQLDGGSFQAGATFSEVTVGDHTVTARLEASPGCTSALSSTLSVLAPAICAPSTQAYGIQFSDIQPTQLTASWTNGNGSSRAVFVKQANAGTTTPIDGTNYVANTVFGNGDPIAQGWYCVYNGTGTTFTITNLTADTDYIVEVFEYNGTIGAEKYNATTASDNPKSQTTQSAGCLAAIEVQNTKDAGLGSLRQAIHDLCVDGTITFNSSLSGQTVTLSSAELLIDKGMTIDGSALAVPVTISGNSVLRVFNVNAPLAKVTLQGVAITNGFTTGDGGGIYLVDSDPFLLTDVTVSNSHSDTGGGGGLYKLSSGTSTFTGVNFTGNAALWGAAIYLQEGVSTINGSTINGNSAFGTGAAAGGIYQRNGNLSVSNTTISNNTAAAWGGGIYLENPLLSGQPSLELSGCILSGNTVPDGRGGAIYINNANVNLTNKTKIINNHVGHITQYGDGGGIYLVHGSLISNSSAIRGNSADNSGGGVYVYDTNAFFSSTNDSIATNTAVSYGGGVAVYNGNITLGTAIVKRNISNSKGGGIYLWAPTGTITIDGSAFIENETKNGLTNDVNYGGALFIDNAHVSITGSAFAGNKASRTDSNGPKGGAIYLYTGALNIGGATSFNSNTTNTTQGKGGAVFNDGGTLINNPSVTPPTTTTQPNGNFAVPGASAPVGSRINFTSNTAGRSGGAIFTNQSTASTTNINCNFTSNTAVRLGGSIYLQNGTLENDSCLFELNTTTGTTGPEAGGAINHNSGTSTTKGSTFRYNGSISGGGVYFKDGTASLVNSLLYGNTASAKGGAIYSELASANLTLTNSTLTANSATTSGGGIFNLASTAITVNNSIVWNNSSAGIGKQLSNLSGTAFSINNSDYGNGTNDVSGIAALGAFSINKDPLFVDTTGSDFRLKSDSPALDAGDNTKCSETNDIRSSGFPRKLGKATGTSGTIDMGAYEYYFGVDPASDCVNPTDGGIIATDQSICSGETPAPFTNTTSATGSTGTLTYKWQWSTTGASANDFADINAANSDSYTPSDPLTATTWYRRLTWVGCKSDSLGAAKSNSIKITVSICAPPTQASAINFVSVDQTQFDVDWTNGDGATRVVFVKQVTSAPGLVPNTPITPNQGIPVDGTNYIANTIFGSGDQIETSGWYCVYNGTGSTVTVTGLTEVTEYSVRVFEYNGSGATAKYQTSTGTNNPKNVTTSASCTNPTLGGTIATDQTICAGDTPAPITSTTVASGQTGTLEYKWQSSSTSDIAGFTDISSSNSLTYSPGILSISAWYKRLSRVSCKSDWIGAAESNSVKITVNLLPTVSAIGGGAATVCINSATPPFTDVNSGGVWSITSGSATASITTGGVVTGLTAGTVRVTYTVTGSGCTNSATKSLRINALPTVAAIGGGAGSVCVNSTTPPFTEVTDEGVWSITSGSGTASITNGGVVTGLTAGTVSVTYTVTGSGCTSSATKSLTINALPTVTAIGGGAGSVCVNSTTPAYTDVTGGGIWSITSGSGTASITTGGIVTGLTAGTVSVTYTVSSGGCTSSATKALTINPLPLVSAIGGGALAVCVNSATPAFTDGTTGGTWSITAGTGTASVTSGGIVTGLSAGTVTVRYTISTGCGNSATKLVTVNPIPAAPAAIVGKKSVCVGSTTVLSVTTPGGVWSSSAPSVATVFNSGIVSGISAGTTTIYYTVSNGSGCSNRVSAAITVNPLAAQPGAFTVSASVIKRGSSNVIFTVPNVAGVSYAWNYSGRGATINGNTNSVKVSFSSTATSGTLSVTASNGCGTSSARTVAIILNDNGTKSDTLIVLNPPVKPALLDLTNEFKVFPNPTAGPAIFEFRISENAHVKLDIFSMNGSRLARIYDGDLEAGVPQTALFEQYLPTGLYPCILQYNGKILTLKFAVRH